MIPSDPVGLLHVIAALVAALVVLAIVWRHQRVALWGFLLLVVATGSRAAPFTTSSLLAGVNLTIGDISVYPEDIVTGAFLTAGSVRIVGKKVPGPFVVLVMVLFLFVGLLLLAQMSLDGPAAAVSSIRQHLLILGVIIWSATTPKPWDHTALFPVVGAATLAALLASASFLVYGLRSNSDVLELGGEHIGARPTSASVALLALTGLVVIALAGRWLGAWRWPLGLWLGMSVLLLQHRSVWLAGLAAAGLIAVQVARRGNGKRVGALLTGLLIVAAALPFLLRAVHHSAALATSTSDTRTWEWRLARWRAATGWQEGAWDWLVGQIASPQRPNNFSVSAHSLYVDSIDRLGLIGLAVVVGLWLWSLRRIGRVSWPWQIRLTATAAVTGWLAYGASYQLPAWTYLLVGVIAAAPVPPTRQPGRCERHAALPAVAVT
jgi:hypothetical protein